MVISEIRDYDKKRKEIVLSDGAQRFLLYNGEYRGLRLSEGQELTEAEYRNIIETVLKPRARKRALYYLKDSDKTRAQLAAKLKQGLYPEEVIEDTLSFLEGHRFLDDRRFAESYIEELKGKKSGREMLLKLRERGVPQSLAKELVSELTEAEDEYAACLKALSGKLGYRKKRSLFQKAEFEKRGSGAVTDGAGEEPEEDADGDAGTDAVSAEERRRAYAFLARRGFSHDAIEYAFRHLSEDID